MFLYFRKVTQKIFLELDETKAKPPNIYRSFQKTEEEMERPGPRAGHTMGRRGQPWPAPPMGEATLVHS
jgi:hypothetical protein